MLWGNAKPFGRQPIDVRVSLSPAGFIGRGNCAEPRFNPMMAQRRAVELFRKRRRHRQKDSSIPQLCQIVACARLHLNDIAISMRRHIVPLRHNRLWRFRETKPLFLHSPLRRGTPWKRWPRNSPLVQQAHVSAKIPRRYPPRCAENPEASHPGRRWPPAYFPVRISFLRLVLQNLYALAIENAVGCANRAHFAAHGTAVLI